MGSSDRPVRANNAALWTSGTKPVSDFTTVLTQADAATIAHLAAPINKADLADFEGLAQVLERPAARGRPGAKTDGLHQRSRNLPQAERHGRERRQRHAPGRHPERLGAVCPTGLDDGGGPRMRPRRVLQPQRPDPASQARLDDAVNVLHAHAAAAVLLDLGLETLGLLDRGGELCCSASVSCRSAATARSQMARALSRSAAYSLLLV